MDLILWRHAEAEPGEPDMGRRLTGKGTKQAERMSVWLDAHLPDTCRILVSPADRAQQTAQALNRKFRTVAELVLIVGHQPTLGMVASFLLSGEEAYWSIRKGAVWWLSNRAKEDGASVVLKSVQSADFL
jgi:phosphohistidine phosphatase